MKNLLRPGLQGKVFIANSSQRVGCRGSIVAFLSTLPSIHVEKFSCWAVHMRAKSSNVFRSY